MGRTIIMDLKQGIKSSTLILFLILITLIQSTHTRLHGRRHKRQHGAHLYLPESYIIPSGEGRSDEWGPWGSPSECSRTCGGGVAYQTRECLNIGPDGQPRCSGGNKKYFSCNSQDCPESELDFRSQQCSHFDSIPFEGVRYNWVPYTKAPNPCELNCMPRGERFYYRHKAKVIDGTRCNEESLDVCVDGICQPVGCDMMLGSAAREDKCRKCAGDGTSCKTVSGILDMNNLQVGYNDILLVPAGATNIEIKERSPSNNYLAIRNLTGHYYLNGNWRIDFPRPLTFAGGIWHYDRRPQGFAAPDHITCIGPTTEPVYLVLLYQDRNVGINYEYSVPEGSAHLTEPDTYSWTYTPFSGCSNTCGGGFQTRTVTCNSRTTLEQVDGGLCDQSVKPSDSQQCGQESCPPRWAEGPYTKCSASCGNNGTQTREVHCEHVSSTGVATTIDDSVCLDQVGNKPASVNPCNIGVVCPEWHIGPWQPCNKLCGTGKQTRKLKCFRKIDGKINVLKDDECPGDKPEPERECILRPCEGVDWIASSWSGCKTCGLTQETRTVFCASKSGTVYNDTFCGNHQKPELARPCDAPLCEYQWFKSQWSKCSTECGKGVQTRNVVCAQFDGDIIRKTEDESKCAGEEKPIDTKECEVKTECPGQWFSGPWTECSKQCGGGIRTRKVLCLADGKAVPETQCSKDNIEFSSDECNTIPCVEDETIPVDSTANPIEEDDEGEEYCDEDEDIEISEGLLDAVKDLSTDGIATGIELESSAGTEPTFITDDLMLSDATGFETDMTDSATDKTISTIEGSGESSTDPILGSSEGSGDEEVEISTDISSMQTESKLGELSSGPSDADTSQTDAISEGEQSKPSEGSTATAVSDTSESVSKSSDVSPSASGASEGVSESVTDAMAVTSASYDASEGTESIASKAAETSEPTNAASETTSESVKQTSESSSSLQSSESTSESSSSSSESSSSTSESSTQTTDLTESSSSSSEGSTTEQSESTTPDIGVSQSPAASTGASSAASEQTTTEKLEASQSTESEGALSTTVKVDASETTTDATTEEGHPTDSSLPTEISEKDSSDLTSESAVTNLDLAETGATDGKSTDVTSESDTTEASASEKTSGESDTTDATAETGETEAEVSTVSGPDASTVEGSEGTESSGITTEEVETTTVDIWSTISKSDGTDEEEIEVEGKSTPYSLLAIVTKEQTPRKCKLRPKIAACLKAAYGCCPDNSTAAIGPFDEGCPTPETCKDTQFGCCPDGVSPAKGRKNKGCPKALCTGSLFGCCPDGVTESEGENNDGCPIITTTVAPTTIGGCAASKYGCCPDGLAEASGPDHKGCEEECDDCTTIASDISDVTEEGTEEGVTEKDCSRSQFGCCPDRLSEATGEHFHGCSIIDEQDCTKSFFGCCSDNRTAAKGPNDEGCSPCLYEPFGCCPDGNTPAHGRNYEGCCLETAYGCCPDNINPANGPQLEGCGCEYSPYGCCPDNKTAARGRDNEGCGCKHTEFGCCPDKQTPAQGEQNAGCPCHTFQFGCCPDGVTVPQGPHNYGCHCSQSEHKCCSDGVTPAKGPNFEGCTCATSRYGCCPDGVTDAQGSNFEACENVPTNPQKACSLKKDLGTCMDFTVKNFYDSEYGACTRFWYSGCGGNENRFETNEECVSTCEQPEGRAACLLPKIHGPCTGYYPSYYYDSDRNVCSQFIYGGCLGNNNRFETVEACQKLCVVDQAAAPCDQPVEPGPCNGTYENWYFDKESDSCRPFVYGGCKGNKNRYASEHACNYHCKTPGSHKASCAMPKETGHCDARHARWHYSQTDQKCMPFYYTGCGGNTNSYVSLEQCEEQCPPLISKDLCLKPAEAGDCQNYTARWYFDTKEERCRQFYYGGCGGSDNNFLDEHSCMARCQKPLSTVAPPPREVESPSYAVPARPHEVTAFDPRNCNLDADSGPCRITEARWYYNRHEGLCDMFAYGGCSGNANNFHSAEECETNCGNIQNPCALPPVYGRCQENTTRWHYDIRSDECVEFTYSGCRGNKNNFYTNDECRNHCQRRAPPAPRDDVTKSPSLDVRFGDEQPDCAAPVAEGNCNDNILLYFYNQDTASCEAFQYTGCGGNGNRFESLEQCERYCGGYKETDVCQERVDAGPCDQLITKYYFNQMSQTCEPFTYSGCEGNGNRFNSQAECQSVCISDRNAPKPVDHKAICSLDVQVGDCGGSLDYQNRRWFYDDSRGTCMSFIFSGCGGNENNFISFESCVDFCTTNEEDNRIDHANLRTVSPGLCQQYQDECGQMHCPYGITRSYDQSGCERCECENPCRGYLCPDGAKCAVDIEADQELGTAFAPVCRQITKPGNCPTLQNQTRCDRECYDDADCRGENKCCYSGCGYVCVHPYEPQVTYPPEETPRPPIRVPGSQAPALERIPQNEVDVVQPEGDVATLRCYATGYPLPTVTWKRGTIIINTNQGRYVLTSTGDLQIVQVHRSDSGTYVCVADNGIGVPVQREVALTVSDPQPGKAYIVGEANSTKIVNLKQSASIRCLAGGYPKPYVSWWKGSDLLPLKSDRYEVNRDYSLVFNQVDLSDLGPYICHAYSGKGKPVSIYVTLKAYGPVQVTNAEDEPYLQYIVSPSDVPVPTPPSHPYRPPIIRPPHSLPRVPEQPTDIPVVVVDDIPRSPLVPVTTNIILPNGNTFGVGAEITIQCDVQGYPTPTVTWYKNDEEIYPSQRVRITESNRLVLLDASVQDSGYYKCSARNEFSQSYHAEQINVDGVFVPVDCTDNPYFANCKLIVKAKYCTHKYYAKFCCKSCTLAGQLYFTTNLLL